MRDEREALRKQELAERHGVLRIARDATATTRSERRLANAVIATYEAGEKKALRALSEAERRDLRALPFAKRPTSIPLRGDRRAPRASAHKMRALADNAPAPRG